MPESTAVTLARAAADLPVVDLPLLVRQRKDRLLAALGDAPFDVLVTLRTSTVEYVTGYRSLPSTIQGSLIGAVVTPSRTILVASAADWGPARQDHAIGAEDFVPFGTFFYESRDGDGPATLMSGQFADIAAALAEALHRAGAAGAAIGLERPRGPFDPSSVAAALAGRTVVDAESWVSGVRGRKLPGEVELLRAAARLAELGIDAAIEAAAPGVTEAELAGVVSSVMVAGGMEPRFVVVTAGERSACSDAVPTARPLQPGDLLRFDIGGTRLGYWCDVGRTAVVGEPSVEQARRYAAILDGEQAQLDQVRPGVSAAALFDLAVSRVERGGVRPYRRHHCGHGIGMDVYEPPIINGGTADLVDAGMTFCFETPFYELGWGGMMVEDTLVVTADGHERLTESDRSLRVIPV